MAPYELSDTVTNAIPQANILMSSEGKPLLSDFGCAKIPNVRGYTTDFKSSERYIAPELAIANGSTGQHLDVPKHGTPSTKESDVWAFGMVGAEVCLHDLFHP